MTSMKLFLVIISLTIIFTHRQYFHKIKIKIKIKKKVMTLQK